MIKMFDDINTELVVECLNRVQENDMQHREDHLMEVALNATVLAKRFGLGNLIPFKLAALIHDIFSGVSRKDHHLRAGEWARENLPKYGYATYAELVGGMCDAHGESGDGVYRNLHEEIFSAADRGPLYLPNSVLRMLNHLPMNGEVNLRDEFNRVVKHLTEKFGKGTGYSCYNRVHAEQYGHLVEVFQHDLKHMTFKYFVNLYEIRLDIQARMASFDAQYELITGAQK